MAASGKLYYPRLAMTTLFDPIQAGQMYLSNRAVMAPLTRNRAPGAIPTPLMATY